MNLLFWLSKIVVLDAKSPMTYFDFQINERCGLRDLEKRKKKRV